MEIQRYKVVNEGDQYTLELYIGGFREEFASELGDSLKKREGLLKEAKRIAREQYPNIKIKTVKIVAGAMVIGVINFGDIGNLEARAESTPSYHVVTGVPVVTHTVKSGEYLSVIARQYNVTVTDIKDLNGLKTDMIYVGQNIQIPYYSYTVVGGDSLYLIAKKLNTTVTAIKEANKLTTDQIFVGQKFLIPISKTTVAEPVQPAPAPTTVTEQKAETIQYTVKSGDSLSLIAKNHGTTVQGIQSLNSLTSTIIYPGQVLSIPTQETTTAPTTAPATEQQPETNQQTTYTVVSGDSLSVIAKKFNVTVEALKSTNNLTSDMIFVGQQLKVPPTTTEQPQKTTETADPPKAEETTETTTTYTVVSGDTLGIIAKRYETTVTSIKQLNNLTSDMIFVGQKLSIPEPTVVVDQTPPTTPTVGTLQVIRQSNVSAYEIKGSTEPQAKVFMTARDGANRTVEQEILAGAQGDFTIKQNLSTLQDGTISIEVTAIDQAGNKSTSTKQSVIKDVLAPTNLVISDQGTVTTKNQQAYQVSGSVAGASTVRVDLIDQSKNIIREEIQTTNNLFQKSVNLSSLRDGIITVRTIAVDAQGNESNVSTSQLMKDTASPSTPTVTVPSFINTTNQHAISITGKTDPSSLVSMIMTDNTYKINKQVTADVNGNFTIIVDARILNEGTITVETKSTDNAGNESESTIVQTTKDVSVSDLVVMDPPTINNELVSAYTIQGRGEPNTSVELSLSDITGATITKTVQTNETGSFEGTWDISSLQDGTITILAYQTDVAENKSNVITKVIKKDTAAPSQLALNSLDILDQQNASTYPISGTGEPLSTVETIIKDSQGNEVSYQEKVRADGTFSIQADLSTFTGEQLEITSYQVDEAGNLSPTNTDTITADLTGPESIDLDFAATANATSATDFSFSGVTEPNASVELELTDGTNTLIHTAKANEKGMFNLTADLSRFADGLITGRVLTQDAHENAGVTKEISFQKDTAVVDITAVEVQDEGKVSATNVEAYSISGVSQEEGAVVTIEVTDGVTSVKETALVVDGTFQIPLNLKSLTEGTLQVNVTQQDPSGNTSTQLTQTIQKDTVVTQPVVQTSQITRTTTGYLYQIEGLGEENSTVTVTISGQSSPTTLTNTYQLNETGAFSSTIDITALNGQKPFIIIKQVDDFGNESKQLITGVSSYVVGSGDTLWKISRVLGTTIQELRSLNNLTTDMIFIGQKLKVPLVAGLEQTAISEQHSFNMGYLYFGSSNTYMETMKKTQGTINVVSPTYFDLNSDGTLKLTQVLDRHFIASMQSSGIRVVPFVSNHWDRALGEKALDNREVLTDQIAEAVRLYNLDGVNIDIENVTHEYRREYTEFTQMLRAKIPADKEVSVAVAANPSGSNTGWHGSYDYSSLGQSSDYLMIMAYDESYTGSEPGPIASIDFVERSIQYAINSGVPKEKIVLGIGHYGRYWKDGIGGNGISNEQVADAVKLYNGVVTFDQASMSPKATFTIKEGDPAISVYGRTLQPGNYTVWFENEESIRAKFELVDKYGIKGTGNWGLAQENPQFWSSFSQWIQETKPVSGEGSQ
jgi:spore germination protein YaaH